MSNIWDVDFIIPASSSPATDISRLTDALKTLRSNWSAATEPAIGTMVAYMWWADTTTGLLKIRNAANNAWITVGTLASVNLGLLASSGGSMTGGVNEIKTTVASAASPTIFTATIGNIIDYTGTTTCTGFGAAPQAGCRRTLICAAAAPFTTGANLSIDGLVSGTTYVCDAGDRVNVLALTTTTFRLQIERAAGGDSNEGITLISSQSAPYTLQIFDRSRTIWHPTADNNARTFTIPANSSVAFPIGTTIDFVNEINTVTIAITTDTMVLSPGGATGSRTLAASGMARAKKVSATRWYISGSGLT